jgi:hypothetical protein
VAVDVCGSRRLRFDLGGLGAAQHTQGQDPSAHQADCRYSYLRQTHKNRLSTLLVRVYRVLFVCSEAISGRTGME